MIPKEGAPADAVHQMLKDELDLDGRPNLNLASFVGTYVRLFWNYFFLHEMNVNRKIRFGSKSNFLISKSVLQLHLLPKISKADSEVCVDGA